MSAATWRALLYLRDDDLAATDHASQTASPPRFGVLSNLGTPGDGTGLLVLYPDAKSREDALGKAAEEYVLMRARAGLDWLDPQIVGVWAPEDDPDIRSQLIFDAAALLAQGRNELVVLRVQTAAELAAERAYERVIAPKLSPAHRKKAARLISRTLSDDRSRNIYEAITARRPDGEGWWREYQAHLKRRNAVVHDGITVDRESAEASVRAALSYIRFMEADDTDAADARRTGSGSDP